MKKITKALLSISLTSPVLVLPLINAAKPTQISANQTVNVHDETYKWGNNNKSSYTCKFSTDTSGNEYAILWDIAVKESVEKIFTVPATVTHNGKQVPLTQIDTYSRFGGEVQVGCSIEMLDFTYATNLETIVESSFMKNTNHRYCSIGNVNFCGAYKLNKIGKNAFRNQDLNFDNRYADKVWNWAGSGIKEIDALAFYNCCTSHKNDMREVIFPDTLTRLNPGVFDWDEKKQQSRPWFQYVVFTHHNPGSDFLVGERAYPGLWSPQSQIVVPHDSLEAYRNQKYWASDDKSRIYASNLDFENGGAEEPKQGSLSLVGLSDRGGADTESWVPYNHLLGMRDTDCTYMLTNDYNGQIQINDKGKVTWSKGMAPGTYKFRVIAQKFDDTAHTKLSVACSEKWVTLTIAQHSYIMGGNKWLDAKKNVAGQDTDLWEATVTDHPIQLVNWSLEQVGPTIRNKIHINTSGQKAQITWDAIDTPGTYSFILKAQIDIGVGAYYYASQSISIQVRDDEFAYGMVMLDENGNEITEPIDLDDEVGEPTIQVIAKVQDASGATIPVTRPQFSSPGIVGIEIFAQSENNFMFRLDKTIFPKGETRFHVHSTFEFDGKTYQLVSNTITVRNGKDFGETIRSIPSTIETYKNTADSLTINVLGLASTDRIYNVGIYYPEYSQVKGHINVTWTNSSITLSWDKDFAAGNESWPRVCDIDLIINFRNDTKEYSTPLRQSISFVMYNGAKLNYNGDYLLGAYAEKSATVTAKPFILEVNGQTPQTPASVGFEIVVAQDTAEHKYSDNIRVVQSSTNPTMATLEIDSIKEDETTLKGLDITVYAWYSDLYVYDQQEVKLFIGNVLSLESVPETASVNKGVAQDLGAIWTTWNGKAVEDQQYVIDGQLTDALVVDNGHLKWTGNTQAATGTYDVSILVTKEYDGKTYQDKQWIRVTVGEQPKDNLPVIIGCSVGGAVVAIGAAVGITVGVKKHKAKAKPNTTK